MPFKKNLEFLMNEEDVQGSDKLKSWLDTGNELWLDPALLHI